MSDNLLLQEMTAPGSIERKSVNTQAHPYHMVPASPWPIVTAVALGNFLGHYVLWLHQLYKIVSPVWNHLSVSMFIFMVGLISWFWDIIIEATFEGRHTRAVEKGLRLGFLLFLASEVIFFASLFWAFFYVSMSPSIWIGNVWPPHGIKVINAFGLPLLNTVILLSSGITVTWAHKAIVSDKKPSGNFESYNARAEVTKGLAATIALGLLFTAIQYYEYKHVSFAINDGIFGSVFFLLTGFHGVHVIIGTIFLFVGLLRHLAYHFTRDRHLGFEFAIWYWHFVDVIWVFLYFFVYIWAGN